MTPLAHKICKELLKPIKERNLIDETGFLQYFSDFHCFETTAVMGMVDELGIAKVTKDEKCDMIEVNGELVPQATQRHIDLFDQIKGKLAFLPAPRTWIEYEHAAVGRIGFLLIEIDDEIHCFCVSGKGDLCSEVAFKYSKAASLHDCVQLLTKDGTATKEQLFCAGIFVGVIICTLAVINTPRLIGRRQHMPHSGLQKSLMKNRQTAGKFPIRAWTEIKLEINLPTIDESGQSHEARLTGQKALHFCRSYLRFRMGRLELVSAHWRGDPALGIKRSRYKLANKRTNQIH